MEKTSNQVKEINSTEGVYYPREIFEHWQGAGSAEFTQS